MTDMVQIVYFDSTGSSSYMMDRELYEAKIEDIKAGAEQDNLTAIMVDGHIVWKAGTTE